MSGDVVVVVRGTGSAGQRHLRALRTQRGVTPVAFPTRPERAEKLRAEGVAAIARLDELSSGRARAIVATDTRRHVTDALELLSIGDVLVEKPLSVSLDGLGDLARKAASLDRKVWIAFCLRFEPSLRRFEQLLPSIGAVDSVRIECQSYLPDWRPEDHRRSYCARQEDGGVLRDLSHDIDYATHLFGRPESVFAILSRTGRLEIEAEEAADLTWSVPGGPVVSLRLDYLARTSRRVMRATGAKGELEWDAIKQQVTLRPSGAPECVESGVCTRDELFAKQAGAFLQACDGGDAGPLATFEEGAFVTALTDAAYRSAASGRLERLAAHPR